MILSYEYDFIFIKTRKTASTSVEINLRDIVGQNDIFTPIFGKNSSHTNYQNIKSNSYYNHMSAHAVLNLIGPDVWDNSFKFCVERNSWDKAVSHFWMDYDTYRHQIHNLLPIDNDYDIDFLNDLGLSDEDKFNRIKKLFNMFIKKMYSINKSDWRLYTISDKIILDHICLYDNLDNEIKMIHDTYDIPISLPLVNYKNEYKLLNNPYQEYFTKDSINLIRNYHSKEISYFGFKFDS